MVCVSWLLAVTLVAVWSPHTGAESRDSGLCQDLSSGERILNFIHLCKPPVQAETPEPRDPAQRSTEESLSLGFLLAALASEEKTLGPLPEDNSQERRSYSMEHFRWGKPAGRKRRPIKVFASPSEGGDSVEGAIPSQARREADTTEGGEGRGPEPQAWENQEGAQGWENQEGAQGWENQEGAQGWENQEGAQGWEWFSPKPVSVPGPPKKKDGAYRMGHFRWGGPPAAKRYGGFMRPWVEQSQKPLLTLFKNVMVKDV